MEIFHKEGKSMSELSLNRHARIERVLILRRNRKSKFLQESEPGPPFDKHGDWLIILLSFIVGASFLILGAMFIYDHRLRTDLPCLDEQTASVEIWAK